MAQIIGTVADITKQLREMNLPDDQEIFVDLDLKTRREALRKAMDDLSDEAERNGMTHKDLKEALEIDEEEFQNIFGHPSE